MSPLRTPGAPLPPKGHSAPDRRSARALDLRHFAPAAITLLAHRISATATATYRPRFGVGITDWRIMALLAAEPWIAPVRIAESTGLDKGAVSRALRGLREAGLAEASRQTPLRQRSTFALTAAGLALHDQLVEAARERERCLLEGFSAEERGRLLDFVERMLNAVDKL